MYSLAVISGDDKGKLLPIKADFISIGRSSKCEIILSDKSISRRHAEILITDGQVYVRDAGSSNGSFVNNKQIKEPCLLKANDYIRLGAVVIQLIAEKGVGNEITTQASEEIVEENVVLETPSPAVQGFVNEIVSDVSNPQLNIKLDTITNNDYKDPFTRLKIICQVGDAIKGIADIKELLQTLIEYLQKLLIFDNGFIMLKDEETGKLSPQIVKRKNPDSQKVNISKSILEKVVKDRVSLLIENASSDARFEGVSSVSSSKISSAMCAPMIYKDELLGIIYLDNKQADKRYKTDEQELLNGIANQAASSIAFAKLLIKIKSHARIERDFEIAKEIQNNYLPKKLPRIPNFDTDAFCLPSFQIGGDYYDIIDIGDGKWAVIMAEVSGKGIPAALLVNTIRLTVNIEISRGNADITSILSKIDQRIFMEGKQTMFATVFLGILDVVNRSMEYISAGHNAPLLYQPGEEIKFLRTSHKLLGFSEGIKCATEEIFIPPDCTLLLYTDGIPDLKNSSNEFFGEKRIREVISEKHMLSAREIKQAYLDKISQFKEGVYQFDDLAMMALKSIK